MIIQLVGVYIFINLKNKHVYSGQSQILGNRIDDHRWKLFEGKHEITELNNSFSNELKTKNYSEIHSSLYMDVIYFHPLFYEVSGEENIELSNLLLDLELAVANFFKNEGFTLYNDPINLKITKSTSRRLDLRTLNDSELDDYITTIRIVQQEKLGIKASGKTNSKYLGAGRLSKPVIYIPEEKFFWNINLVKYGLNIGGKESIKKWANNNEKGLRWAHSEEIKVEKYLPKYNKK